MIKKIKQNVSFYLNSRNDWTTKEKLVVIESDDWGSIRMPSIDSYNQLYQKGVRVDKCPFLRYDNMESVQDFDVLQETFDRIYHRTGKKPIITANYIMANPDFGKIRESNFEEYHRKFFGDYLDEENLLNDYKNKLEQIIKAGYFYPQLHGLEHLNVIYWMDFLKRGSEETMLAFEHNVYGISTNVSTENRATFLAELDYLDESEFKNFIAPALKEAVEKFEEFFGFKSMSFIAPNYIWSKGVESVLNDLGIEFIQSSRKQILPKKYNGTALIKNLGTKNDFGQSYLVRNCIFEPATTINKQEHTDRCFRQISNAFLWNKPAIISSHRLNFMGGLVEENRTRNLKLIEELLMKVIKRWPQVKFINSVELGEKILKTEKR